MKSTFISRSAKSELPEEMRYDMTQKIEAISIPETAKIKGFLHPMVLKYDGL